MFGFCFLVQGISAASQVSDPVITARLIATGQAVKPGGPQALADTLTQQAEQMATVAKALGLKAAN